MRTQQPRLSPRARLTSVVALLAVGTSALIAIAPPHARAQTLQAPIGGNPIALPVGAGFVICPASAGPWTIDPVAKTARPPSDADAVGRALPLPIAHSADACANTTTALTLIATNRWPSLNDSSVVWSPDESRLEAKGRGLEGVVVAWHSASGSGSDVCHPDKAEDGLERCSWSIGSTAASGVSFAWSPAGARASADAVTFDANGQRANPDVFALEPAKIVLRRLTPLDASVDLSKGRGEVPLVHPDAVAAADCGALACEMNGKLLIRGSSSFLSSLEVRLHLRPHVYFMAKDALDAQPSVTLPVTYCPMSIVSGPPIRNNDRASAIIKLDNACGKDVASLVFRSAHAALRVRRIVQLGSANYVWLYLGNIDDDDITVTAMRADAPGIALAAARATTRGPPSVRASLEIPGFPNLDFIPNNRPALVHVGALGEHERAVLLPVDGVYSVKDDRGQMEIEGDRNAAGLTELHFGIRNDALPDGLNQFDLAEVTDPLQRPIHAANIPAPIGAEVRQPKPLIEMLCGGGDVPLVHVAPGVTAHLSFSLRDTCRVIFHRERLSPEYGTQKLKFEIEITQPDGGTRSDGHVSETFTFRSGDAPRYAYIRGIKQPFDRVTVRVYHEPDEAHYIGASDIHTGTPAAQWSAVLGTGHVRLYGTTTIPTGLYRLSSRAYSGVLSLNFGVISRLTWLDADGHEGFLGLEGGVLVMGLANSTSETGQSLTQVGGVLGLGVSVPIANRSSPDEASLSLHVWAEADLTRSSHTSSQGRYALIFGPSLSIGNVGANL